MKLKLIFSFIGLALGTQLTGAQTTTFTYQGRLNDKVTGRPAPDGNYIMRFDLVAEAVAPVPPPVPPTPPLGSASKIIPVTNGMFTADLNFGDLVFPGADRWLEITVGGDLLTPRQRITSVPYAVRALKASSVAANSINNAALDPAIASGLWGVSGANIYRSAGNVGIGATAPGKALQIGDPAVTSEGMIRLGSRAGTASRIWDIGVPQADEATVGYSFVIDDLSRGTDPEFIIRWNTGNVGIGTTDPQSKLDVAGAIRATSFSGPGTLAWQVVSGASQQAQPNTGYLLNGLFVNQSLTLPTSLSVGDVVRVSSLGSWKLIQTSGQSVISKNLSGNVDVTWTARNSIGSSFSSIACSADGTKLVAVQISGEGDAPVVTSGDSGCTWGTTANLGFYSAVDSGVASSADGCKLVVAVPAYRLYTTTDYGRTWTARENVRNWKSVASSSDGSKLAAVVDGGFIYISTDSGFTWGETATSQSWASVATSADGSRLVAVARGGRIFTSTDSGLTWTQRDTNNRNWSCVASSAGGVRLVAAVENGLIYTSSNAGLTWEAQASGSRAWKSVASSADGGKLVAVVGAGRIYTSTDSGVTWTERDSSNRGWTSVASSASGTKLAACAGSGGGIYTSGGDTPASTTVGPSGYLAGNPASAIELQYIGAGVFMPLSHEGTFIAY